MAPEDNQGVGCCSECWGQSMSFFIKAALWSSGRTGPFDHKDTDWGPGSLSFTDCAAP